MRESFFKYILQTFQTQMRRGWWRRKEMLGGAFVSSCFVLGCERHHAHPLRDEGAFRWGALKIPPRTEKHKNI